MYIHVIQLLPIKKKRDHYCGHISVMHIDSNEKKELINGIT